MNKKLIICALITFISLPNLADDETTLSGAELINNNCARCHNSRPVREFSISEWRVIMPHMREKAHLTGSEVKAILEFMEIASSPAQPVEVTLAKSLTVNPRDVLTRYGCQGCHQVQGVGGSLGPALDDVIEGKGEAFFIKKVKEPQFNNAASAMPQMPITDEEIAALVDYLNSL